MDLFDIVLSLSALILLEIILGIDNLIFLSILTEKLPAADRRRARRWGLCFAWVMRLTLLAAALWISKLTTPLLMMMTYSFSIRDLFLVAGGAFLIVKATQEIHYQMSPQRTELNTYSKNISFRAIVFQIGIMDIIFSIDSVLAAIGLTSRYWVMAIAITCAILVMVYASEVVSRFIDKYPTIKMLALCFLILIGMVLAADGFSFHIPRAYVYFAMAFSLGVEALNLLRTHRQKF